MTLSFGRFSLDPANESLTSHGRPIRLRPKSFALLAYLAGAAGRVVTKHDLLDTLWPDTFVGDAALKTCMREIREALGDDARKPQYIETAHRRGYRFIARIDDAAPAAKPFAPPRTRYTHHADGNIAYQIVGSGPIDLVMASGWLSHLEQMWAEPSYAYFLARLSGFSRLIVFDARGTGLSDRLSGPPSWAARVADLVAVLDAAGSNRAVLFGVSDAAATCCLFAASHPERTLALVLFGAYAKGLRAPGYRWGRTREQLHRVVERIEREWGGPVGIEDCAPSRAADAGFRQWWSTFLRRAAPPTPAAALARMNAELDVRAALPSVRVPALVLHRVGDRVSPVEAGRHMARSIATATMVELRGEDHLPFVGDQEAILDRVERFLASLPRPSMDDASSALATA
jgi:pimeloyl-ACP methyl ester carboxylesterase